MSDWTPIKDAPRGQNGILCNNKLKIYDVGSISKSTGQPYSRGGKALPTMTHWLSLDALPPLPQPPKEES